MNDSELSKEVLALTLLCQQGSASDEERARLEYLLAESESARLRYNEVVCDTVTLADLAVKSSIESATADAPQQSSVVRLPPVDTKSAFSSRYIPWSIAGLLLAILCGVGVLLVDREQGVAPKLDALAHVVHVDEVVWDADSQEFSEWSPISAGDVLRLKSGMVELEVDNAVQVVLQGPAEFELVSRQKAIAHSGKLVARVSEEGIGFEIETPHTQVFDQGTAFGLSVSPMSQTGLVVYEGEVDLAVSERGERTFRRLKTGEAMQVGQQGQLNRITAVNSTDYLPPLRLGRDTIQPSRLIDSVSDNVASLDTAKYYRIIGQGFADDCSAYVDRAHQWNGIDHRGIPTFLKGADYVMTYNDDKVLGSLQIALDLAGPATVYVMWDDRIDVPQWLKKDFVDTGWDIGLDEGYDRGSIKSRKTDIGAGKSVDFNFSVWQRDVATPSTVVLGSVQKDHIDEPPREVSQSMYGIAVKSFSEPVRRETE